MLVSVIIPCFNVEEFISSCIASVLNQTYPNTEIICVDNNSTDNTLQILKDFEKKYLGKITVLQEFKKGAPAARNKGLSIAKGEWIQFFDADDLLLPQKIEHQIKLINTESICPDIIIGATIKQIGDKVGGRFELITENVWEALIKGKSGSTCSNLYKSSTIFEIGGWDEKKKSSQESYLLFELLKRNKIIVFDEKEYTIVRVRLSGSITHSNKAENWERFIVLREEIWVFLRDNNKLTPQLEVVLKQVIFDYVRFAFKDSEQKSIALYNKFVKNKFKPVASVSTPKNYLVLYNLVGFSMTEKIKKLVTSFKK